MPFNGAGSTISSASDVVFNTPANNEVVSYNSATAKWVNRSVSAASDATTVAKGIVQLAGDLGGTAANPTVPGLANKADEVRTITGTSSVTGGGDLTANRTLSLVNDNTTPGVDKYYGTNAGGTKGWYTLAGGGASGQFGHIFLDDMAGATDDDKLTAAITAQQATAGMPPIVLGARNHSFNVTRTLYSGLKLIGQSSGPKNLEQDPDFVTSRITLGAALSSGTASWWVTPGGNLFDIYMADFAVQGSAGSSKHQFIDVTTGSLYACEFHSLAFNFMRSVFGRKDRKCLVTQVVFSGHWTANNLWDTQFMLGGADCQLWVGGYINIGPSSSPLQTGTYADNDYQMLFDSLSKTDIGYIFTSSLNGWRGIKVTGSAGHGLRFFGGTYEGYKPSNDNLAAPGTVIRLEGGSGAFFGPSIGQAMQNPDAAEGGPVHVSGGEWAFYSPNFYRSPMAETEPCIYHTGGRLLVQGATRHEGEAWTNRPRYYTSSSGPNSTETSFYCPDMSMISV